MKRQRRGVGRCARSARAREKTRPNDPHVAPRRAGRVGRRNSVALSSPMGSPLSSGSHLRRGFQRVSEWSGKSRAAGTFALCQSERGGRGFVRSLAHSVFLSLSFCLLLILFRSRLPLNVSIPSIPVTDRLGDRDRRAALSCASFVVASNLVHASRATSRASRVPNAGGGKAAEERV